MTEGGLDTGRVVEAALADLEDVEVLAVAVPGVRSWARSGVAFVRQEGEALELRLPADIADAALRTPDTGPAPGIAGWVRLVPRPDDPYVADRMRAWIVTAWRHAATGAPSEGERRPRP